ncbi:uncharacterized protein HMPREF1541_06841 [Cyphellophora europaea CBS 101466]|uniref:Enoyl reductase (ER) domain-containing protein n=1 Tax=Cyphellophora europaea (strain CBS 101466) TaxID=1220924 RepID=W2RQR5_CYPE1|nr:uncharacterized protein HMPREF1541_06841 [Cyphellophora europaea CBS 101466]ETN38802.1 hypothetical protein HMPREF1541_06841 [Cyphellophora europaea CBS 101466]
MVSENRAAFLVERGESLQVGPAPVTNPGPNQVLVRNRAIAINPVDWMMRDQGVFPGELPDILGCDLAGDIVEVGTDVKGLKVGQRVLGHALRIGTGNIAHSAFQEYTVVEAQATTPLPDSISYEAASVLPLSLSTAAQGLYSKAHLALPLPSHSPDMTGKTILVWGGSGSVGAATVQLASASGLTVISTSSPKNFDFVKGLGAKEVFDYNKSSVVADVVSALQGQDLVGAFDGMLLYCSSAQPLTCNAGTGSKDSAEAVAQVMSQLGGGKIASALNTAEAPHVAATMGEYFQDHLTRTQYHDFLPRALETGQLKPAPPARVVGRGLEALDAAATELSKGVSATKLVVTL